MKPIKFHGQNVVYAEHQPEYLQLPAFKNAAGRVTTCWHLSWHDRMVLLLTGRLWLDVLTFNGPLQPLLPRVRR